MKPVHVRSDSGTEIYDQTAPAVSMKVRVPLSVYKIKHTLFDAVRMRLE